MCSNWIVSTVNVDWLILDMKNVMRFITKMSLASVYLHRCGCLCFLAVQFVNFTKFQANIQYNTGKTKTWIKIYNVMFQNYSHKLSSFYFRLITFLFHVQHFLNVIWRCCQPLYAFGGLLTRNIPLALPIPSTSSE